ncbi:hypothetical protein [Acidicapsa acidisoli]|uniref:hypothetical protein n=1 Tax=Acidicapsa acidisoli TaxID=1615681 RepID=UPI0021DF780A|nr:hypothetical protein [Acidicapsa acidisoli]
MNEPSSLSFEEFLRQRNEAKTLEAGDRALFRMAAEKEWQRLKERVRQITEGKMLGADLFEWSPYPASYPDFLKLKDVALLFEAGTVVGDAPQKYRVVFSRRPLRSGEMWADREPIPAERWWLTVEAESSVLYWAVRDSRVRLITEKFGDHIAMQLVEYQQRYMDAVKAKYPWAGI